MKVIAVLVIVFIMLPVFAQEIATENDAVSVTELPPPTEAISNDNSSSHTAPIDASPVVNTEAAVESPTLMDTPLDASPVVNTEAAVEPPTLTDTPMFTETLIVTTTPIPSETSALPVLTEESASIPPSPIDAVGTAAVEPLAETATTLTLTALPIATSDNAVTDQQTSVPFSCQLDVDDDGIVTANDLAIIERELLYTVINDVTVVYDLNGNHELDIGDIQKMGVYFVNTC